MDLKFLTFLILLIWCELVASAAVAAASGSKSKATTTWSKTITTTKTVSHTTTATTISATRTTSVSKITTVTTVPTSRTTSISSVTSTSATSTSSSPLCPTGKFNLVGTDSNSASYNYSASINRQAMDYSYLVLSSNNPTPAVFDLQPFLPPNPNSSPVCVLHDVTGDTYAFSRGCPTSSNDPMDPNTNKGPYRVYFTSPAGQGALACTKSSDGTIFCGCGTADRWYLESTQYVNIGTAYQPARNFVRLTLSARPA